MAVKYFNPTTPSQRFKSINSFSEITSTEPEKTLLAPLKKSGGRNNLGRITARRRGGGHKKAYRIIFRIGLTLKEGIERVKAEVEQTPEVIKFVEFFKKSDRGFVR